MTTSGIPPDEAGFFTGHPEAWKIYLAVRSMVQSVGPSLVRVSTSQVAFRRRRGFAYVWMPGRWLRHPASEVVLSVALGRPDPSPRFKQVAHPAKGIWIHHLEVRHVAALDDEVERWIREAYETAR